MMIDSMIILVVFSNSADVEKKITAGLEELASGMGKLLPQNALRALYEFQARTANVKDNVTFVDKLLESRGN